MDDTLVAGERAGPQHRRALESSLTDDAIWLLLETMPFKEMRSFFTDTTQARTVLSRSQQLRAFLAYREKKIPIKARFIFSL